QLPDPGRADEPPRRTGDRGARAGARRVRGHGLARDARPALPPELQGDPDAGAATQPGAGRSSRPSLTSWSTTFSGSNHLQLNHLRTTSRSGATTAAHAAATTSSSMPVPSTGLG